MLYDLVLKAQKKAIESVNRGVSCRFPDKVARDVFGKYNKYFIHGLGQGIGLDIHENPSLSKGEELKFQQNMIYTIEPGLYLPNKLGIRIEDDLFMKEKGVEILTKTGKNLLVISK
jgi:Xaa-Pro dipeptidase